VAEEFEGANFIGEECIAQASQLEECVGVVITALIAGSVNFV